MGRVRTSKGFSLHISTAQPYAQCDTFPLAILSVCPSQSWVNGSTNLDGHMGRRSVLVTLVDDLVDQISRTISFIGIRSIKHVTFTVISLVTLTRINRL